MSEERALAVVLAAGAGSRFRGRDGLHKLLYPVRGRPLLSWAMDGALGSGLDVLVVTGAVDVASALHDHERISVVHNPNWAQGQATSLAAALAWAAEKDYDAIVVGLGDQPLVPAASWRAVASARGLPMAVAVYGGERRNPVRLAARVWPLLPVSGDEGARTLMRQRPDLVEEVACPGDPMDIDTVEELSRWI